jgi:hypothetical protein
MKTLGDFELAFRHFMGRKFDEEDDQGLAIACSLVWFDAGAGGLNFVDCWAVIDRVVAEQEAK